MLDLNHILTLVKSNPQEDRRHRRIKTQKAKKQRQKAAQSGDQGQSSKKKITVVIGDSIIKNIQGWRLSDCNNHAVVKSFGGANCSRESPSI